MLSVITILAYVYLNTSVLLSRQTNETIDAEITGLAEQYRSGGLKMLVRIVTQRSQASRTGGVYLLTMRDGRRLAGNIPGMPPGGTGSDWVEFAFVDPGNVEDGEHIALARRFRLAGGYRLLVGRDIDALQNFNILIRSTFAWALALTLLLGLGGGLLISRNFLARIEQITNTSRTIIAGDLARRIPVIGSNDEIDQLSGSLNDMLDEIELLMAISRQVTDNVAHDLRTPLSRMRARIEDVVRLPRDSDSYREALELTLEDIDRLMGIFNALLSIARIESSVMRDQMASVELSAVLADTVELYEPLAEERSITLRCDIEKELAIHGDRQLLGQAFANLIDNAIKYAPGCEKYGSRANGLTFSIAAQQLDQSVEIILADNGPGIIPDDRERVFSRFVRLEQSRTEPGSGLGLSLVAAVLRLHGGSIRLEDNEPGLRIVINLPTP